MLHYKLLVLLALPSAYSTNRYKTAFSSVFSQIRAYKPKAQQSTFLTHFWQHIRVPHEKFLVFLSTTLVHESCVFAKLHIRKVQRFFTTGIFPTENLTESNIFSTWTCRTYTYHSVKQFIKLFSYQSVQSRQFIDGHRLYMYIWRHEIVDSAGNILECLTPIFFTSVLIAEDINVQSNHKSQK